MITVTEHINALIAAGAMSEKRFFELEIAKWKTSEERQEQITGEKYYRGQHDILKRRRTAIGRDGKLQEVHNLPNNKLVNNQYGKIADQKNNYLLGKPFNLQTDDENYELELGEIFNKRFHRTLKNLGEDSLNCGVGWLYVYYDEKGELSFKRFAPWEILPFWKDDEHTVLDCVVRVYETEEYEGDDLKIIEKVEIYKSTGVERYILQDGVLREDGNGAYFNAVLPDGGVQPFNWEKIPVIAFKYNDEEQPLICRVKSLQDALNDVMSDFQNNMQEDARNTVLVIKNYDGADLSDFRYNLMSYGAVKVRSGGQDQNGGEYGEGGVETLQIQVNSENYKVLIELLKQAIIENARGFDAKELKSGTPNQMNIKSMYSDIDLDANGMETEWQAAFEDLLYFVNAHLANTGKGDFEDVKVEIVFNRDILMNESDVINNVKNSVGILSMKTLLAHNPWVDDVSAELERIEKEKQEAVDAYADAFPKDNGKEGEDR